MRQVCCLAPLVGESLSRLMRVHLLYMRILVLSAFIHDFFAGISIVHTSHPSVTHHLYHSFSLTHPSHILISAAQFVKPEWLNEISGWKSPINDNHLM